MVRERLFVTVLDRLVAGAIGLSVRHGRHCAEEGDEPSFDESQHQIEPLSGGSWAISQLDGVAGGAQRTALLGGANS